MEMTLQILHLTAVPALALEVLDLSTEQPPVPPQASET